MIKVNPSILLEEDSNIDRTIHHRLRTASLRGTGAIEVNVEVEQLEPMAASQRSISDCGRPNMEGATFSIVRSLIKRTILS